MIGLGTVSLFLVVNASLQASLDDTVDNQFEGDVVIDSGGSSSTAGCRATCGGGQRPARGGRGHRCALPS